MECPSKDHFDDGPNKYSWSLGGQAPCSSSSTTVRLPEIENADVRPAPRGVPQFYDWAPKLQNIQDVVFSITVHCTLSSKLG